MDESTVEKIARLARMRWIIYGLLWGMGNVFLFSQYTDVPVVGPWWSWAFGAFFTVFAPSVTMYLAITVGGNYMFSGVIDEDDPMFREFMNDDTLRKAYLRNTHRNKPHLLVLVWLSVYRDRMVNRINKWTLKIGRVFKRSPVERYTVQRVMRHKPEQVTETPKRAEPPSDRPQEPRALRGSMERADFANPARAEREG